MRKVEGGKMEAEETGKNNGGEMREGWKMER